MCDNRGLIFFLSFAILLSCSTQKIITSKNEERGYYEDLSILRSQEQPKKSIKEEKVISSSQVKNNISLELDTIIQIIRGESDNIKFLDGFTIQLYLGDNRNKAEETEQKITEIDSLIFKNTVFTQPNYRVKIGQYIDRFKVNEEYQRFKKLFPNAIIIPEKIKIN
tara:strand:+ start:908 stop:1405 length:498 start_codon:yes stop_codon:yes gene_type:complete